MSVINCFHGSDAKGPLKTFYQNGKIYILTAYLTKRFGTKITDTGVKDYLIGLPKDAYVSNNHQSYLEEKHFIRALSFSKSHEAVELVNKIFYEGYRKLKVDILLSDNKDFQENKNICSSKCLSQEKVCSNTACDSQQKCSEKSLPSRRCHCPLKRFCKRLVNFISNGKRSCCGDRRNPS